MPPPLLRTHMIKLILQHVLAQDQSQRRCAQALGISKGVVAKYVAAGLDWPAIEPLAEPELEARLVPARGTAQATLPDFAAMHRELSRKGVTLMLLWQEYQALHRMFYNPKRRHSHAGDLSPVEFEKQHLGPRLRQLQQRDQPLHDPFLLVWSKVPLPDAHFFGNPIPDPLQIPLP